MQIEDELKTMFKLCYEQGATDQSHYDYEMEFGSPNNAEQDNNKAKCIEWNLATLKTIIKHFYCIPYYLIPAYTDQYPLLSREERNKNFQQDFDEVWEAWLRMDLYDDGK